MIPNKNQSQNVVKKVFQFQFSKFVKLFRKWGILILCHNLPIKKKFLHFDKKNCTQKKNAGWMMDNMLKLVYYFAFESQDSRLGCI
jgi:hypothetical protein